MPTTVIDKDGNVQEIESLYLIPPQEGELNQYYGRIGNGKTYAATRDAWEYLQAGYIVKTNWRIAWPGRDERKEFWKIFLGMLGLKKEFLIFPKENLQFFKVDENFYDWIGKQTSCIIFIDEGHIAYDSYKLAKMSMEERLTVLNTRHYDRIVNVISQRPTAIHSVIRGNVNRFYKCELISQIFGAKHFKKTEFQDTKDDVPDETRIKELDEETHMMVDTDEYEFAISEKTYWGTRKWYRRYDSKYLRGDAPESQKDLVRIEKIKWRDWFKKKSNV